MSKRSKKYEVYDLRVLRENLSQLRANLREALGLRRRPLLRRFREEYEEPEKVVIVEREPQAPQTSEERLERLKRGYVKESYRSEVDEEPKPEVKRIEIGLGLIPALREIFRQSAEQVKLETERKKMILEFEKRKLEEEERKEKLKPKGWHY